jgi:hypothetical protein
MQPSVTQTEIDGALGVQPAGQSYFAMVGVSDSGPIATPAAFARTTDVISTFAAGPLVEAACYHIATYEQPVLICRATASVGATESSINVTGVTGTSVVTFGSDTTANDDYEMYFVVVTGGTIGTASPAITYQTSNDNGRTLSPITALGTANTLTFPNSGGIVIDFAAGTLVAGDVVTFRTVAPTWASADLGVALAALKASTTAWDTVSIVGPIDATSFAGIAVSFGSMPEKSWIGHTRIPLIAESEGTYLTSLVGVFGGLSSTFGMLTAGSALVTSAVTFRQYQRPVSFAVAPLATTVSPEIDISALDVGSLPGVVITDKNGNNFLHNESINPGLDDARFCVLRTWDGEQGVFVNNPNLFSPSGSDFSYFQHRRIMNLLKRTSRIFFQRRLSKPIAVDTKTGFILESEAKEIEASANAAIRGVLLAKPMVSGGAYGPSQFVKISRTDNLLSTKTLNISEGVIPLAYPKAIIIQDQFTNPIVQTLTQ